MAVAKLLPMCEWHRRKELLSYTADALRRMKRGQEQKRCPHCLRWFWPDEYGTPKEATQ
jgi:hypothetical protein